MTTTVRRGIVAPALPSPDTTPACWPTGAAGAQAAISSETAISNPVRAVSCMVRSHRMASSSGSAPGRPSSTSPPKVSRTTSWGRSKAICAASIQKRRSSPGCRPRGQRPWSSAASSSQHGAASNVSASTRHGTRLGSLGASRSAAMEEIGRLPVDGKMATSVSCRATSERPVEARSPRHALRASHDAANGCARVRGRGTADER